MTRITALWTKNARCHRSATVALVFFNDEKRQVSQMCGINALKRHKGHLFVLCYQKVVGRLIVERSMVFKTYRGHKSVSFVNVVANVVVGTGMLHLCVETQ